MAELGSIQYEDSRQRTSVRDQNDQRDLLQGIKDVGEAAIEARTEDILGELRTDLDETTREALEPVTVEKKSPNTGDPEADALISRIQSLETAAAASSGNTQKRVEMELRKKTEQLRRKFPGLRRDIDAEFGAFKATDADFAKLGLKDAGNASFSAQAAQAIKDIKDEAYGDAAGQLGLDPIKHQFGTKAFANEYLYRSGLQQQTERNTMYLAALNSQRAVSATELPSRWNKQIAGKTAAINVVLADVQKDARLVAEAIRNPMVEGASEMIGNWNLFGKDQAQDRIEAALFAVEIEFQAIPVEFSETPEYAAIKSNKDALVEQFRLLGNAVATGDPTLMDVYDTVDAVRTLQFEGDNPDLVKVNTMVNASKNVLELAMKNEYGTEAQNLGNEIAKYINTKLPNVLATAIGASGQANAELPPNATPEQLKEAGQLFVANNVDRYGSQQSAEGNRVGGVAMTQKILGPAMTAAIESGINPTTAAYLIGGIAGFTSDLVNNGPLEYDAWNEQMGYLANPVIMKLQQEATNSGQPRSGEALGEEANNLFFKKDTERLNDYITRWGSSVGAGIPLAAVAKADVSDLKNGNVSFIVDEEAINTMVEKTPVEGFSVGASGSTAGTAGAARRKAQQAANALGKLVSTHLKAKAHIAALRQAKPTADYVNQWESGKFKAIFDPEVEVDDNG